MLDIQKLCPQVCLSVTSYVVQFFGCSFIIFPDKTFWLLSISVPYIHPHRKTHLFSFFISTHLAVMIGHSEKSNGAVGIAAVADRGHVSIPHDRHRGQRLAGSMRMRNGVALSGRRGKLGSQCKILLDLLVLVLVEVELGVLQVTLYLQ